MTKIYNIYKTEEFDRKFEKLDGSIQREFEKEIDQLRTNPFVGKPLGYDFFREKKVKNYRIYYLIYDTQVVVFVVSLSDKKDQQETIDKIKSLIPFYKNEIKKMLS